MLKYMVVGLFAMAPFAASALTFESGQVLVRDESGAQSVVDYSSTSIAQRELAEQGYSVGGGVVVIAVGDESISIPQYDLVGKSQDSIVELISAEIVASGFASGGVKIDGIADEAAHEAASAAAQAAYQSAVEVAVKADNIANGVAEYIADEASRGFSVEDACNLHGQQSACEQLK